MNPASFATPTNPFCPLCNAPEPAQPMVGTDKHICGTCALDRPLELLEAVTS